MSVAFDNVGFGQVVGGITVTTAAFTIAGANRAVAIHLGFNITTVSNITCSCGGVNGTLVQGSDSLAQDPNTRTMIFVVLNPPTGSQTATASWTGSANGVIGAISATGVDQTTPMNNGTFNAGLQPRSITISSVNGDLTTSTAHKNGTSPPIATNQTSKWAAGNVEAGDIGPGTGTTTHTWTGNSGDHLGASGANFVAVLSRAAGDDDSLDAPMPFVQNW